MYSHSLITRLIQLLTCVFLAGTSSALAQDIGPTNIALRINLDYKQFAGRLISFDGNKATERLYNLPPDRDVSFGRASGGVLVRVERVKNGNHAWRLQVDTDGDENLSDET